MNSWKLLFNLLIIGLMTSGLCKPSEPLDSDYPNDADEPEYDDESDQTSGQKQGNNAKSKPPAYFKLSDYTETVKAGESVTLKCDVGNFGATNLIMWYKGENMKTLLFQSNYRVTRDDRFILQSDHSLTINHVDAQDEDTYVCNVLPDNISMKAKLVVLTHLEAHIFERDRDVTDRSFTYRQGERIEVECRATGARSDKVEFKWSAGGERLVSDGNINITGGKIVINKADREHVRVYQCLADNGADGAGHASVTINIQYTPRVTAHRSVINTKDGDNAELYCDFETSTESRVIWSKENKPLPIAASHEPRSKYAVIYTQPKAPNKNTSILVVSGVKPKDLGEYECRVENIIGSENVTIELTNVPEPPQLHHVEKENDVVITHWHIRSLQPLKEVMLNYQQKGTTHWRAESPIDQEQSKEHSGLWKIKHKLALAPGHWHARVKARNAEGWSRYSTQEDIIIDKTNSANTMTLPKYCAIPIATLLSIYSIHFSTRLFG